jgi:hypothetical protein
MGKFGGDKYKPHQLGPEPAEPAPSAEQSAPTEPLVQPLPAKAPAAPKVAVPAAAPQPMHVDIKAREPRVQFSSRIRHSADLQLKALAASQGVHQT